MIYKLLRILINIIFNVKLVFFYKWVKGVMDMGHKQLTHAFVHIKSCPVLERLRSEYMPIVNELNLFRCEWRFYDPQLIDHMGQIKQRCVICIDMVRKGS